MKTAARIQKKMWLLAIVVGSTLLMFFQNCSRAEIRVLDFESKMSAEAPICQELTADSIQPKLKWNWVEKLGTSSADYPLSTQVMSTPMVGDLNQDGIPEVVFVTFTNGSYNSIGVLRIVNGKTGETLHSIGDSEIAPFGSTSPVLVDLDGDGMVEIVYTHYLGGKIIALNFDGSFRWSYQLPGQATSIYKSLAIADLNGDGKSEILTGQAVIQENSNRMPIVLLSLPSGPEPGLSFAASLNPSTPQKLQIISSKQVFNDQGLSLFNLDPTLSYGVADLDKNTPGVEIIGTGNAQLKIYNGTTGAVLREVALQNFNELICKNADGSDRGIGGGAPSIGDFDGDPSTIEIAMATGRYLIVFRSDGSLLAKFQTQDCSSLRTGISSFDFNGDGKPEILYGDEEYFRIFEIRDGTLQVVFQSANPSGTLLEYPVVADIDGNGSSEILVVSNNYAVKSFYKDAGEEADGVAAASITGVRAFEAQREDAWMPTRPLWNQYDYNPGFTTDGLTAVSSSRTDGHFTSLLFRRNTQLGNFEKKCQQKR